MGIRDIELTTIDGGATTLADFADQTVLVVNVASRCGLTPQYEQLEELQKEYGDQGFTVLGFPCNQFMGQEPGTTEDIKEFCSITYGVTFPLMDKVKVNGRKRHPLYAELTKVADDDGKSGKIRWNFEKFVIAPDGSVSRFSPWTLPDDPKVIAAIEEGIASATAPAETRTGAA
jgi:glutathione peroxidase